MESANAAGSGAQKMNGESTAGHDRPADDGGISGLVNDARRLASEARAYAEAEIHYQVDRAKFAAGAAARIAIYGAVAVVFAVFALGALVIGLLISLATLVGPWLATLIVVGTLAVAALVFALAAKRRFTRTMELVSPPEADDV